MRVNDATPAAIKELLARQRAILDAHDRARSEPGTSARLDEIARACRMALRLLEIRHDLETGVERRDPLPKDTVRALERLRRPATTAGR